MTTPPSVTVVVPNYNHARFLARRLDSIFAQTYTDWELLYLDDASTDDSADVFAPYAADPRVRAILNTQNTGSPFVQWNRGVREARGEYVWIAEADDDAAPRLLETLVPLLDNNPNVGVAYCQSLLVDENNTPMFTTDAWLQTLHPTHWKKNYITTGREECRSFLVQYNTIPNASGALFRKTMYDHAGGADEAMRACGDWLLYAKIMLFADVAFVSEALNYFRKHSLSVTHKANHNGLSVKEAYQVVKFISHNVDIDKKILKLSCEKRMNEWREAIQNSKNSIPLKHNFDILRLAWSLDAHLPLKIVRLLLKQLRYSFAHINS